MGLPRRWPSIIAGLGVAMGIIMLVEGILILQEFPVPDGYYWAVPSSIVLSGWLVVGGYRLSQLHIPTRRYHRAGGWFIAGAVVFTISIIPLSLIARPPSVMLVISAIRWSVTVGGGVGLLIGVYDVRARQRAFEAGRAELRQEEIRRERDRLDEFASVIAHDLRNPLVVAAGRLDLAQEECDSDHLDAVAESHDRMETLIEDVLSLARAGEAIAETESVELASLVENCWGSYAGSDASLVCTTDRVLQADESRLRQLLENLFRNAVEHGGDAVTVTVGEIENGFYVEDDGPGIPEAERESVFDAGYSQKEQGTGFGLNIVQEIAEAHGWTFTVTEGTDGGARFEFTGVS